MKIWEQIMEFYVEADCEMSTGVYDKETMFMKLKQLRDDGCISMDRVIELIRYRDWVDRYYFMDAEKLEIKSLKYEDCIDYMFDYLCHYDDDARHLIATFLEKNGMSHVVATNLMYSVNLNNHLISEIVHDKEFMELDVCSKRKIIPLYCLIDNVIDGVFVTETTTSQEIQKIINKVKEEHPSDWMIENITDNLPNDCKFYGVYDMGGVYY